jgi:hypothetical protein
VRCKSFSGYTWSKFLGEDLSRGFYIRLCKGGLKPVMQGREKFVTYAAGMGTNDRVPAGAGKRRTHRRRRTAGPRFAQR